MLISAILIVIAILGGVLTQNKTDNPYESLIGLNTLQYLEKYGYPSETHYVTSKDGYITAIHRIPYGLTNKDILNRPTLLIIPGLTSSSAEFVNFGPGISFGLVAADFGLDVWISNNRGQTWSRNHSYLNPNKERFWDFSWHEIGYYDIPAMIDYILKFKGQPKLFYLGHSQGTTAFMVMGATRPEYNQKIKLAGLVTPSALLKYVPNHIIRTMYSYIGVIRQIMEYMFKLYGIYDISQSLLQTRQALIRFCKTRENREVLTRIMQYVGFLDQPEFNPDKFPVILSNSPAGASIKQILHYYQILQTKVFAPFDYGLRQNLLQYGKPKPEPYNISKVTAPIAMYYGKHDTFIAEKEVKELSSQLPNVVSDYLVPYELSNHVDFLWGQHSPDLIYKQILKDIKKLT